MEPQDLEKIKLPLSKDKFQKLRSAIKKGQVKFKDLSKELTYAYQDFWRYTKYKNCE